MATILFAAAGAALGSAFGGTVLGLSGAVLGKAVGAAIGRTLDQRIIGAGSEAVEIGRIDRFHIMGASEGAPIPKFWGRMRLAGQVIWASPFRESSQRSGGKGMPSPKTVQYSYSVSLAVALSEGEILGIGRVWTDGDEISLKSLNIRVYHGTEDQLPDPLIEAHVGDLAPAYRGTAYVVLDNLDLSAYGNRVPQFSFEVMRRAQGAEANKFPDFQDTIRAVALIPGTGEYALASQKIHIERDLGHSRAMNINSPSGDSDLVTSLGQLSQELPNCSAVSLVVSWFGNDLRCAVCEIQPKVEQTSEDALQMPWRAGGIARSEAQVVPRIDGMSIYGGTPSDESVIESIAALKNLDQSVMFYPFVLMDQIEGNNLADPYSENSFQASLPWRGRITLSEAPGRAGSPDQSETAVAEVAAFFGSATPNHFSIENGQVHFSGPREWGYRRFILHYAYLCHLAGGVEAFCIGSELRGITHVRGPECRFPAVEALIQLAADVRSILGPDVKISYAADWSEYFGLHTGEDVFFHLDPLWADSNIDFVGIDNYMPVSDWREGSEHADASWKSIYSIEYLKSNISGGEGYDWFYESPDGVDQQVRVPIRDVTYGEDWVFRYKDILSWWSLPHHNRLSGERLDESTAWIPRSKPIRFTEYGCAAIDKGTNEPNKFLDPRSSESSLPRFSLGIRDDFIQMQYFKANFQYWCSSENNPVSDVYGGPMLDVDHCYAWAWDLRPFPEFPRNTSVWSDGPNYDRGHWLNGRATSVPLDRLLHEICSDAEVQAISTDWTFGAVPGYSAAENQSARSRIQPLSLTFGFDCFEAEAEVNFQSRFVSNVINIIKDEIVFEVEETSNFEVSRGAGSDSISRLRFSYLSVDGSFSAAVSEAVDLDASSAAVTETEFAMLLHVGTAKAVANRWLSEARLSQDHLSLRLPLSEVSRVSGSTIRFDDLTYRIDHIELDDKVSVRATRVEPLVHLPHIFDADVQPWRHHSEAGSIFRLWLDLPLVTSQQVPHAPFLAVASEPWPGPLVLWSSNEDSGYELNSTFEHPSLVGKTLSELPWCQSGIIDRGSELIVDLPLGNVDSVSFSGMLSGMNLVAIGDGSPENWEIFQFMNARLISSGSYALSFRIRGLAGTESVNPHSWPIGSYVVLLNDRLQQVSMLSEQAKVNRHYRLEGHKNAVGSGNGRYDIIAFRGIGLRPLSVSHFTYRIDSESNHHFRWIRRTRSGGDSWDGFDVPLSEEREIYLIAISSMLGDVVRSQVVEAAEFIYTSGQRLEDGLSGDYHITVSQVSIIYGAGSAKTILVSS